MQIGYISLVLFAMVILKGCYATSGMSFEQDYTPRSEEDFYIVNERMQPLKTSYLSEKYPEPLPLPRTARLRSDRTEEAQYLGNIIQLLKQSKMVAAAAHQPARDGTRKAFDYNAFSIDIDTIIFALKRYLYADDSAPRRFNQIEENELKAQY